MQEETIVKESFIIKNGKYTCPKCGSCDPFVWGGMFVDKFICRNCGYTTYM